LRLASVPRHARAGVEGAMTHSTLVPRPKVGDVYPAIVH